jgi:hypothetical protein
MARNVARSSKKQLGSKNTRAIGAAFKKFGKTLNPWGPNIPVRRVGHTNDLGQSRTARGNTAYGSSTKKPTPAPELKGMQYTKNDPTQWPVEPDYVNHTRAPDPYGITSTVVTNVNKAVEDAYTRAKYQ